MPCLQKGVNKEKIAKSFPYGKVEVKVVGGGLRWHSGIIATGLGKRSSVTHLHSRLNTQSSKMPAAQLLSCTVCAA